MTSFGDKVEYHWFTIAMSSWKSVHHKATLIREEMEKRKSHLQLCMLCAIGLHEHKDYFMQKGRDCYGSTW